MSEQQILEIVQKAKEDEIEKRVYQKIQAELRAWKFIGAGGAVVLAILLTFHGYILEFLVEYGGKKFQSEIDKSISEQRSKNSISIMRMDYLMHQGTIRLDFLTNRITKQLDEFEKLLSTNQADMKRLKNEMDIERSDLTQLLADSRDTREDTLRLIGQAQKTAQDALAAAESRLDTLAQLVANQNALIKNLPTPPAGAREIPSLPPPSSAPKSKSTVYFQFAGFPRPEAEAISRAIKARGWFIPGEERTPAAVGTNLLRYHPNNVDLVNSLLTDANDALKDFKITLKPESNTRVTPGIPEIWIHKR